MEELELKVALEGYAAVLRENGYYVVAPKEVKEKIKEKAGAVVDTVQETATSVGHVGRGLLRSLTSGLRTLEEKGK